MAILTMERINLCAMKRDRKKILELLQRRGTVEIKDAGAADEVFEKVDTSVTRNLFTKNAATAVNAVEILNKYTADNAPSLAFLRGRQAVSQQENKSFEKKREEVLRKAQRIAQLEREVVEAKAEILRIEAQQEALRPWMQLPMAQTFVGTKKTAVFIGTLEGERTLEDIVQEISATAAELEVFHVEIVSKTTMQTSLYVIVLKKDEVKAEETLRFIGLTRPSSLTHHTPEEKHKRLEARLGTVRESIAKAESKIITYDGMRDELRYLEDHMKMRAEKYEVLEQITQSKHVFVLEGYIPSENAPELEKELSDNFQCSVEIESAGPSGAEVPVKLKNSWFTEPTESVVESYSMPSKTDVDPTSVMSIFYYIMFGLMFSDAAYGLIMVVVCMFCLLKFKNMEPNWSKNIRMFLWCGVSTVFWGIVFSSYFGDVVNVVSRTFFGNEVRIPPLWFTPLEKPMLLLVFSLGVGTIHLTFGYIMKAVTCLKNKDYSGIFLDAIVPLLAWYPLLIVFMGVDLFKSLSGFKLNLPAIVSPVCMVITCVAIVITLLTSGRESKNWGKRLLKGIYGVYSLLSGWLSDTLSYSRLLALGLATGVIAQVMNMMGALVGKGFIGVIVFILVFAAGQGVNFGINVLGAYVHSNRLAYVEFFGKFYEGGGRKFNPFGMHTKHYKITEEENSK